MGANKTLVEYIHSSEIIEFFWFIVSLLFLLITCIRIFKYNDNLQLVEPIKLESEAVPNKNTNKRQSNIKDDQKKTTENVIENDKGEDKIDQLNDKPPEIKHDMNGSGVILGYL